MRLIKVSAGVCLSLVLAISVLAQTSPVQRDPQAIAILTQCLNAAGGIQAVSAIQDVTATGTITFDAMDQSPQGSAKIKLLGLHRFRLDASLPDGMHSYIVGKDEAFHKNPDGSTSPMPPQNRVKPASATFPLFQVLAAVQDGSFNVTYSGLVTHNGQQAHDILVQQTFGSNDLLGARSKITRAHIYIDPTALTVQAIDDQAYRRDGEPGETPHEMQFSNYQEVNGILAPFSVIELLGGQKLSTIQMKQLSFNSGLAETDFQ